MITDFCKNPFMLKAETKSRAVFSLCCSSWNCASSHDGKAKKKTQGFRVRQREVKGPPLVDEMDFYVENHSTLKFRIDK